MGAAVLEALGFWSSLFAVLFFVGLLVWWRKKQQMLEANSARNVYRERMEEILRGMGKGQQDDAPRVEPGKRPRRWSPWQQREPDLAEEILRPLIRDVEL